MAAKIGLGYSLPELINRITKVTTANFEPSLDYIVLKMPRWDFRKFELVKRKLGSTMKSVGEVMAIGRTFEEVIQKAIRMCEIGKDGLVANNDKYVKAENGDIETIEQALLHPNDEIVFTIVKAIQAGMSIKVISQLSSIDPWFLARIKNIVHMEDKMRRSNLDEDVIKEAKRIGFSDKQIGRCLDLDELKLRSLRKRFGIKPVVKQIDTLAAEWPAKTNYLYLTYGGQTDDIVVEHKDEKSAIVLGAGPYRIGSSVEFDWGTVNMVWGLKENGIREVSIINCNPETVSMTMMSLKGYILKN